MAYRFGKRSEYHLRTVHPDLQRVIRRALTLSHCDFGVLDGFRDEEKQNAYFDARPQRSKVRWPDGRHNSYPSEAADLGPWIEGDVPWNDSRYWYMLAGAMHAAAKIEGVAIRWGGDWDGDGDLSDQRFNDLGHFELARN